MNLKLKIQEINTRLSEIDKQIDSADAEALELLEKEAEVLVNERKKHTEAMRMESKRSFTGGSKLEQESREAEDLSKLSKRDKIAYSIGKKVRNAPFTEVEKRALGVALTSTATTYVAATAELDGVNNAGVFIPTVAILDLLREEGFLSPIMADIKFTAIPGMTEFPYRKSRDKARSKSEGAEGKENQMEWGKLTGAKGYLQTIIAVTDEVRALTDFALGQYILSQILEDINEDWLEDLIYANGQDERIKGIVFGATAAVAGGYESNKVLEAITAAIKLCKGKFRRGAKLYLAQDVHDNIVFAVDDVGNFKYPVFNNMQGVTALPTIRVEVDENLKAGDFFIGNVSKYYKANALIPVRLETERLATRGITKYIASEFTAATPVPGAFIYGSKKV